MGRMNFRAHAWSAAWGVFWGRLAPPCGYCECVHAGSGWGRMRRRSHSVRLEGARYCGTDCLERALLEVFRRARPVSRRAARAPHRIPLGLLLLSRQQLSAADLRTALAAQRAAGQGKIRMDMSANTRTNINTSTNMNKNMKIGAWLQHLGFATEEQVTAALACQWSCPVLRTGPGTLGASRPPPIPVLLLEFFQMMPVELVEATGTLLMAFGEGIDHTALYAIEQMLGYRTEACLVCPSTLQKGLQALARQRGSGDVVFDRVEDNAECARIIGNYAAKVRAEEVRLARCGEHLWIRLERLREEAVNLVLRVPGMAGAQFPVRDSL